MTVTRVAAVTTELLFIMCDSTDDGDVGTAKVYFMHLGPKISDVELASLSGWRGGYSLNYTLWRTGEMQCKSWRTVCLIFAPQQWCRSKLIARGLY